MVVAAPASAQTTQPAPPADVTGKDSVEGVYVRDSAVAIEKLALGDRLARLNEWDKAADVYQEILVGYPDRVVPSAKDASDRIYQYTSVGDAVQQRLAKWPADGLAAYRNRFENEAAALLEQAKGDDPEALQRVFTNYFVTDSARTAAIRLIERYIQNGEFSPAVWLADRMLTTHPNLGDTRPLLLYRAAIAAHLMGDDKLAAVRAEELKRDFPQTLGSVGGKDVVLLDTLNSEIASTPAPVSAVAGGSWRMPFGSPDRSAVPATTTTGTARIASIKLAELDLKGLSDDSRKQLLAPSVDDSSHVRTTGILPAVDRGELFFQDNARIYAVNLQSGQPLPGWAQTYNNPRLAPYRIPAFPNPRGQANAVVLTDESVLAVMGQMDQIAALSGAFGQRDTRLVCLDRATGRERWVVELEKLPQNTGPARVLDLVGSPLVVGQRVYVMGRSPAEAQFEDAYVLCFDLSTGGYLWSSYLASASSITPMVDMDGSRTSLGAAHLAYFSGRIYALASAGVLSAVDAYSGATVWIDIYPHASAPGGLIMGMGLRQQFRANTDERPGTPLMVNPVIVSGGNIFVLPPDSQNVLVYDAASGREVKRIGMGGLYDNSVTLIGVIGNRLVFASADAVHCIDWQKYDPKEPGDAILWRSPSAKRNTGNDRNSKANQIIGRPFLTTEHVFVTTANRLNRINLRTGSVEEFYPREDRVWPKKEGPGNVIVAQNHLIIAGSEQVVVYTDTDGAKSRLDAVIATAPTDPEPRLSYAEICFAADEMPQAVTRLDEAIDLLGGRTALTPGRVRERLFQTTLGFAEELASRSKKKPEDVEFINGLYDRAAAAADGAPQQVAYRFSRGNFLESQGAAEQQVTLYQEIISDPTLRGAYTSRGNTASSRRERAGDVARDLIAQLIMKNGAAIYDASDRAATAQFQAAQAAADPTKLLDVSETYPNSGVARQAFLAAADAYEQGGQNAQANWVLRQYLFMYADPTQKVQRAAVFESMSRNYLAMPGRVEAAGGRLAAAARFGAKLQHPIRLPDGKMLDGVSYFDATTAIAAFAKPASTPLPDAHVPIPPLEVGQPYKALRAFSTPADSLVVDGVDEIVEPLKTHTRFDRIVVQTAGKGVGVYAPGGSKPLFEVPGITQPGANVAWLGSDLLVWSGSKITLAADGGAVAWAVDIASVAMPDSAVPSTGGEETVASNNPNDQPQLRLQQQQRMIINRMVQIRGNVRINGNIRINGGIINVQQLQAQLQEGQGVATSSEETITRVVPLSDQVVVATSSGRVIAIDLAKGGTRWQSRISEKPVDRLLATDDFVVVRVRDTDDLSTLLTVFDAYDGQTRGALRFSGDLSTTAAPVSLTVTPDGMLVYASTTKIVARDLFDVGGEPLWETPTVANQNNPNMNANGAPLTGGSGPSSGEDILSVAAGRVLLLTDGGTYVRVYSLEDGRPVKYDNVEAVLQTGVTDHLWQVEMRVVGTRLYTVSPRAVTSFNLERRDGGAMQLGPVSVEDALMTRDYLVLLHNPADLNDGPARFPAGNGEGVPTPKVLELKLLSRAILPVGRESGRLEYSLRLTEPSGFAGWQACDGGVYYVTGDRKLHFLKGLR